MRWARRLSPQVFATGGVLVVLAVVAGVTARTDRPPSLDRYASTEYASTGYRAWATLLSREDVVTERFVLRPIELGARTDTLISAQPPVADGTTRTGADIEALALWVRGGGRLVYLGRNPARADAEQRLLRLPAVRPYTGARGVRGRLTGPLAKVGQLQGLGPTRMAPATPGTVRLADRGGAIVVAFPLGRGEVVAVVDPAPFANASLAQAGNARLAFALGSPRLAGGIVAFDDGVHGALIDRPWYRALPIPVRVGLSIAGVALILALSGGALRGAPPLRLRPAREPSSVEFVDALAALYERNGARAAVRDILARDARGTAADRVGDEDMTDDLRRLDAELAASISSDAQLVASAQLAYIVRKKDSSYGGPGHRPRSAFTGGPRTRRRR